MEEFARALDGTAEGGQRVVIGAIGLVPFVLKTCNRIFEWSIGHWGRAALYCGCRRRTGSFASLTGPEAAHTIRHT